MEIEGNNTNNNTTTTTSNSINHTCSTYNMESNVDLYPSMIMIPPFLSHHNHHHNHHHHPQHQHHNNNKVGCSSSSTSSGVVTLAAAYDHHHQHHVMDVMEHQHHQHHQGHDNNISNNINININNNVGSFISGGNLKAKIMAHPHYPRLLSAYVSCQKVGAPPEVVARLEEAQAMAMGRGGSGGGAMVGYVGEDPALDQFMEAYCEMLTKYEQELTKPFKEAMIFLSRIECQLKALSLSSPSDSPSSAYGKFPDRNGSSEEDIDVNNNFIDPSAEDRELKGQLLRKYSGYLGSLRQEFLKKRKKGKLPKEARQQLLDWWSRHYKWPYPSESQKLALAESTGLDQKQINNWFINQRKRHWKPSEDMQFVVMDAASHSHAHHYGYMENVLGNPFPMDISSTLM